ncbi:MAG: hypothetical protein Q9217_000275 [Psora testacea]
MKIRLREPAGQSTLTFADTATVDDLESQISGKTSLSAFDLQYGYPPKPLQLKNYDKTTRISDLDIKLNGEQLIVSQSYSQPVPTRSEEKKSDKAVSQPRTSANGTPIPPPTSTSPSSFSFANIGTAPPPKPTPRASNQPLSLSRKPNTLEQDAPEVPLPTHAATLLLRIMPDDNSCLFRAFNSAFFGAMDNMTELRSVIAQTIQAQPDKYSEAVLDQKPDDYCIWIQTEDAWGGAIELDILSRHFDIEICSIDVQTLRIDRFNEGSPSRCVLVYSGIHYDTIALSPSDPPYDRSNTPPDFDTKVFDSSDEHVIQGAVELCRVLQSRHYYTDTAKFNVKCTICGAMMTGEKGATEHANETGHMDFGEAG